MDRELEQALEGLKAVAAPRRVGRYQLTYRVAQGGMGAVYLAQMAGDGGFRKALAVKILHQHVQDDQDARAMFLDEARITSALEHPNVCRVTDFGDEDGVWYLAMEYLHGEPLRALITSAPSGQGLPFAIAARIIADAARGLHAAHELKGPDGLPANVVHRDVSPGNVVVLYDGVAKVLDFGIAKARTRIAAKTKDGTFKGNFGYVAPENYTKAPVDRRADVYSLGVLLWESTTGQRLFKGSVVEAMGAALAGAPPPSTAKPGYPPALEAIVMRALALDPAHRYPTADAMARELERFITASGAHVGAGEVADYMRALFVERRAFRELLLRVDPPGLEAQGRKPRAHDTRGGAAANDWVDDAKTITDAPRSNGVGAEHDRAPGRIPATTLPQRPAAIRAMAAATDAAPRTAAYDEPPRPQPIEAAARPVHTAPAPALQPVSARPAPTPRAQVERIPLVVIALVIVAALSAVTAIVVVIASTRS